MLQWLGDESFQGTKCSKVIIPGSLEGYGENIFNRNTKIVKPKYIKNVESKKIKSKYKIDGYYKYGGRSYFANEAVALITKVKVERDYRKTVNGQMDAELLKFSSSNSKVVKVTKTGKLQAKKKGSAVIQVSLRLSNDEFHVKGCRVKVKVK